LHPDKVLALVFWTKDPTNLIRDRHLLAPFMTHVHVTVTGWSEVEKGAPDLEASAELLREAVAVFGADRVTWRFSPVPQIPAPQLFERFRKIASVAASAGLKRVLLAFLQENDLMPEMRGVEERVALMRGLATEAALFGVTVQLCNDDSTLGCTVATGVCVPAVFGADVRTEKCGCVLMVDPFTINEACTMGCLYCYAADRGLGHGKRNTTRLPVIR
jgi:DNA repair photolyase